MATAAVSNEEDRLAWVAQARCRGGDPDDLFVRGAASFLARPWNDLVTVTGSRAASAYGEHVAAELAGDLANRERVLVAGDA